MADDDNWSRKDPPQVEGRDGLPPAYHANGVDLTLIRERLNMTPLERMECVERMNAFLELVKRGPR